METLEIVTTSRRHQLFTKPAAINQLPPELLYDIFWRLLDWSPAKGIYPPRSNDYYQRLNPLRLVSSYWSACIDKNPMFWTVAASEAPQYVFAKILNKSRQAPLQAYYTEPRSSHECLRMLLDEAYRWDSVYATLGTEEAAWLLFSERTPLLETVDLHVNKVLLELDHDVSRRVKHVNWTGAGIPLAGFFWWDIRTLRLAGIDRFRGAPTVNEFLNILASCPNLVELTVDDVYIKHDMSDMVLPPANWTAPLNLSFLKTLFLRHVPHQSVRIVLNTITFPQDTLVSIWIPEDCFALRSVAKSIGYRLMTRDPGPGPLVVHLNEPESFFVFGKNAIVCEGDLFDINSVDDEELDDDLVPMFSDFGRSILRNTKPRDHPVLLILDRVGSSDVCDLVPDLARCFPRTSAIAVISARSGVNELSPTLDMLLAMLPDTDKWPFPDLQSIHLTVDKGSHDHIVGCVALRVKAAADQHSGISKLATIVLEGGSISRASFDALRDLGIQIVLKGTRVVEYM